MTAACAARLSVCVDATLGGGGVAVAPDEVMFFGEQPAQGCYPGPVGSGVARVRAELSFELVGAGEQRLNGGSVVVRQSRDV